ncbi:universal stress protein [Pseudonocardia nematodicida]|uniref:Universal stress protein n=1 Tax=Pseudonocardia nematodicida TaxID=1206997 RepID=A0ABV1K895_9PSEU
MCVVVGYRTGPPGDRALGVGAELAHRMRARLHVVHVVEAADYPVDPDSADWDLDVVRHLADQQEAVTGALTGTGLLWDFEIRHGDAAVELVHAAMQHDARFVVLGTRGTGARAAVSRLARASVSHRAVALRSLPVLVVPAPPPDGHTTARDHMTSAPRPG